MNEPQYMHDVRIVSERLRNALFDAVMLNKRGRLRLANELYHFWMDIMMAGNEGDHLQELSCAIYEFEIADTYRSIADFVSKVSGHAPVDQKTMDAFWNASIDIRKRRPQKDGE